MDELIDLENPGGEIRNSTAVLVLGICSIIGAFLYGVPGIICAIIALALSSKGVKTPVNSANKSSYEQLKAGRICAIIGLILGILVLLFVALIGYLIYEIQKTNFSH